MNPLSNVWQHPRTSATGLLVSIVTVAGILAQQGVSLGHLGSGTVVSLTGALATALLGLLARDPGGTPSPVPAALDRNTSTGACTECPAKSSASAKLGVWLLILFLIQLPWLQGCTHAQIARDIVRWTPALQSAVATVDSTAAVLDPAAAPVFAAATSGFDAASNLLAAQARAYLANPSAGTLAQLQAQIVNLQQQVNAGLLNAARIVNPASQKHAIAALQGVATIVTSILALVQSISSNADVARMASLSPIKLAAVTRYMDDSRSAAIIANHYGEAQAQAQQQIEESRAQIAAAGL